MLTSHAPTASAVLDLSGVRQSIGGYQSLCNVDADEAPDTTTREYAAAQDQDNAAKVLDYLMPLVRRLGARSMLDVGCGVGAMVRTLMDKNCEVYGVDLPGLHGHWRRNDLSNERMFIVDPLKLRLPFADGGIDFAFTFGVIEHVGTTDGQSTRRSDHHALRRQWLREVYRAVKPGGAMLIAGPNRRFPIDVAHGPDAQASATEQWLSTRLRVSVHRTWGDHFLWSYQDFAFYLNDLPYRLEPLSIAGFLGFSRVPRPLRALAHGYINKLPNSLLGTGFNPWVMALVHKPVA